MSTIQGVNWSDRSLTDSVILAYRTASPEYERQLQELWKSMDVSSDAYREAALTLIPPTFKQKATSFIQANNNTVDSYALQLYLGGKSLTDIAKALPGQTYIDPTTQQSASYPKLGTSTATPAGSSLNTSSTTTTPQTVDVAQANQAADQQFQQLLSTSNLSEDQKKAVQAVYDAASTHDQDTYQKLVSAFQSATQYSDPFFKAQARLVLDSLDRAFNEKDGDLAYNESRLNTALTALQRDIAASKDSLSFEEQQQLKGLERNYAEQLDTARNNMASRGFTQSSIRSKTEGYLNDSFGDLRESTRRSFRDQFTARDNQLTDAQRSTAAEVQRLRELAAQGKLDALRQAEQQLGSTALKTAGYNDVLGGIGGELPRQQIQDAASFASSFVF